MKSASLDFFVRTYTSSILALGCGFILLPLAHAVTVAEDSFEDTYEIDKTSIVESQTLWESPTPRQFLAVMSDDALGSGRVLVILNGIAYTRIPDTDLEVGQSVTLSFRFRSLDQELAYPIPLRIGLCENNDGNPDVGDTKGYWLFTGPGPETNSGITFEDNIDSSLGGGNDGESVGDYFKLNYDWSIPHMLTIKFSRPSQDIIEISSRIDDGPEHIVRDAKALLTNFNLLAVRLANTPQSAFLLDDLKIEKTAQ